MIGTIHQRWVQYEKIVCPCLTFPSRKKASTSMSHLPQFPLRLLSAHPGYNNQKPAAFPSFLPKGHRTIRSVTNKMASTSGSERPYLTITTNIPFRGPPSSPDSSDGADGEPIPSEDYRRLIAESEQHVLMRRSPPVGARAAVRIMFETERESGAEWQDSTYPDSGPSASASASASDADTGSFDPYTYAIYRYGKRRSP
jgi:hypothetical protein